MAPRVLRNAALALPALVLPIGGIAQAATAVVAQNSPQGAGAATLGGPGPALDIGGVLAALLVVLLCLFAVAWLLRRAKLVKTPSQAGVKVVAQLPLNLKEKLLVVQVGEERLLLGCTPGCIRTLHSWPAGEPAPPPTEKGFSELLSTKLGGSKSPAQGKGS